MTPPALPTCETCRHWVESHVYAGKGVCCHPDAGPRPRRDQVIRDLYTLKEYWCVAFEVRMARHLDLKENA